MGFCRSRAFFGMGNQGSKAGILLQLASRLLFNIQVDPRLQTVVNLRAAGPGTGREQRPRAKGRYDPFWNRVRFSAVLRGGHLESIRPAFTLNM